MVDRVFLFAERNFRLCVNRNFDTIFDPVLPEPNRIFGLLHLSNIVTSGTRNISKRWSTSKNFNRISRANIVNSGTRNISKAWSTSKNFQSHFSRQYRD